LQFSVAKVLHLLKLLLPRQNPLLLRLHPHQNQSRHLQSTPRLHQRQRLRLLSNQRPHRLLLLRQRPLPLLRQRPPQRQPQLLWRQQQVICCHR